MAFLSYKETQYAMSANSDNTGSRTHNSPSKASIRVCCTLKSYLVRTRQLSPASADVVYWMKRSVPRIKGLKDLCDNKLLHNISILYVADGQNCVF